jgi:PEP-CTERM motif-containing protein
LTPSASVLLAFDMFVNDYDAGPIVNSAGLTYTAGPNQHARVDLLSSGAGPFDTGGGVLANYFLGVDAGTDPNPFTHYSFDISSVVGGGGTFQLRFAEVDNQLFLNMGVDNISIQATTVPEPATLVLVATSLGSLGFRRYRQRRKGLASPTHSA